MEKQEKRKHRQYSMLERWKMDTERFKKMINSTKEERERRIQEFIDIVNNKKNRNSKK
ncbi:hypothetical protein [Staphylococcus auricularis]|uniref:hypothetical protein n=1 Tax=Staphylococcus auricularis TaxID=29379 RepID=UPI001F162C54|nr:hypothetical protein [Staphylococcus auricularis]MCE5038040.1 hypothetical protein [Staphylococcus auricularis]